MGVRYAEVIGDPIAHSLSPAIHRFWLAELGLDGDYRATRCGVGDLSSYLKQRCADPFWRGCNVTAPLKGEAAKLALDPTGVCARIGAVNAIFRSPLGCGVGANTDLIGLAAALGDARPAHACILGAGGAARAAVELLRRRGAEIALVARDAAVRRRLGVDRVFGFDQAAAAMSGADCVINATPLGMAGQPDMPSAVLDGVGTTTERALILDMVYAPLHTALLVRARSEGRVAVDGLMLLIGQARPAFELFFGVAAPVFGDDALRQRLAS